MDWEAEARDGSRPATSDQSSNESVVYGVETGVAVGASSERVGENAEEEEARRNL